MLTKISKIQNIRNYHDFLCDVSFTKKNVVYALNGSGKTNLSRFLKTFQEEGLNLQSFEKLKSLEAKKTNASIDFELQFDEKKIVNSDNVVLPDGNKILVYNKDFLEENVSIEDFSIKKHDGSIQIAIISANQKLISRLKKDLNDQINQGIKIKEELENGLTQKAHELQKQTQGKLSTFSKFLQYDNLNHEYISNIQNVDDLKESESNFNDLNKIDESDQIRARLTNITQIDFDLIKVILNQSFKFEEIEQEIENHIAQITKDWIEIGVNFHENEGKNLCPFCRQSTTPTQIIKKYIEYIESSKAKTKSLIDGYKEKLHHIVETTQANQNLINQGIGSKVKMLCGLLGLKENVFNYSLNDKTLKSQIEKLTEYLDKKGNDLELIFEPTISSDIEDVIASLDTNIQRIRSLVETNNEHIKLINRRLVDAGARKSILRKQMAQWALIEFYNNSKERRAQIEAIRNNCEEIKNKLKKESDKSPKKQKRDLIVKMINQTLTAAGLKKYQVDENFHLIFNATEKSKFDITKETILVSDGEKSVIAFAYYIASIIQYIDKFEDLEKVTLIIDDPISSTSYNFMHGIGSLLKNMNSLFKGVLDSKRNEAPQIIVFTHNLQFYNLLIANIFKRGVNDKIPKISYFSLFNKDGNPFLQKETNIRKMSEYTTSLFRLYKFSKDEIEENMGNDLRKVLETICSFHFLNLSHDSIEKIFNKKINTNLKLIADDYVHTDFNNFEDPIPTASLREAAIELLSLIEEKYPSQYKQIPNKT